MKQFLVLFFSFLFSAFGLYSQDNTPKITSNNSIYVEAIGIGGYGSINYDYIFHIKSKIKIGGRIGLSTYHIVDYTGSFNPDIIIPFSINALYGTKHHAEVGIGQTFSSIVQSSNSDFSPSRDNNFSTNFTIGYRYQKSDGGIVFRIGYTPIINQNKYFQHWGGISIGYSF